MEDGVVLKDVSRVYRDGAEEVYALRNVSLHIPPASFASICGPSGSGKTTLLNMIGGLDYPSSGEIYIDRERTDNLSPSALAGMRLRRLGFVFQSYNLIPVLSAIENVEFILQLQGVASAARLERATEILVAVGLGDFVNRRPTELSGGQQQRVAVARALVSNPSIVLADEPTANLDSNTAKSLLDLMRQMNEERRVTFLFSTHDQLVMSRARRIISLHDGEIVGDKEQ